MEDINKRSIKMTRIFNAQPELVWEILTKPEHVQLWWGPEGFTNTIREMDVRVGGVWDFTMHDPNGTDFINYYHYESLVPCKRLVLVHKNEPKFTIDISLHDEGDKTRVEWCNIFESIPSMEETIRVFKADIGLSQNLDRLEAHLNQSSLAEN